MLEHPYANEDRQFYVGGDFNSGRGLGTAHVPWGDIRAVRVQDLDFVVVIKAYGLQVNATNRLDHTIHEKHVSMDDLKALNTPGPDCRVPDPDGFRPFNEPVGRSPVVEVGRWARLGVESATSSLNLCGMQRYLRGVVPPREVGEPVTEESQRREGA